MKISDAELAQPMEWFIKFIVCSHYYIGEVPYSRNASNLC